VFKDRFEKTGFLGDDDVKELAGFILHNYPLVKTDLPTLFELLKL
jgi:hypothetical protein